MAKPRTLYDKIWDDHLVDEQPDGTCLIYIDRHLVHEVTSPQAFEGLRLSGRKVHAPEKTLAVVDHNVPTTDRSKGIDDHSVHARASNPCDRLRLVREVFRETDGGLLRTHDVMISRYRWSDERPGQDGSSSPRARRSTGSCMRSIPR